MKARKKSSRFWIVITRNLERFCWKNGNSQNAFVQVVRFHNHLPAEDESISSELAVVHLADNIVNTLGYSVQTDVSIHLEKPRSAHLLKLEDSRLEEMKRLVTQRMEETRDVFGSTFA